MSVPYDQNTQFMTVNVTMSDGSQLAQLPTPGTELSSDNPNVSAGIFNAGTRVIYARRLVAGPQSANITVIVNGVSASVHPVAFDGAPAVVVSSVAVVDSSTGNL